MFECLGSVPTVQQSVAMTGRGGTTVLVGVVPVTQLVPISAERRENLDRLVAAVVALLPVATLLGLLAFWHVRAEIAAFAERG